MFISRLYWFRQNENKISLKTYETILKEDQMNKINLIESVDIEKNYFPGICLSRIGIVKLSIDLKHFLVYDTLNVNLLEYDLNGIFIRIILKAEERLGNLLAFDFSGDRQHLITSEIHFNKRKITQTKSAGNISAFEQQQRNRSNAHVFKLRIYKYTNCECHRSLNKHETLKDFAKSNNLNQSFNFLSNEPSIATFSKSNF